MVEQVPYWAPYVSSEFRGGNHRVITDAMGFLPLYQDGQHLMFADVRGQFDDRDSREGNWGLGLRSIVNDDLILGGYGFYDHRWSRTGNSFRQITIGAELKTYVWDLRVNGYLADQELQYVGSSGGVEPLNPRAIYANNTILLVTGGPDSQQMEQAYSGLDVEIGALVTSWGSNNEVELRAFMGGYYFDTSRDGFPTVMGPRTRVELRTFDLRWLGEGSRLTVGAEYSWDQARESQIYGIARVQIPLDFFRRQQRLDPFERRMLDRIQRDVDIVTQTGHAPERIENTVYADTGMAVGDVSLADANHSLQDAVAAAGEGGTVIVDGSKGEIHTDSTTTMRYGQTVRGAGFQVRGVETGQMATFGSRPMIINGNQSVDTLVVFSNSTVRDLDIYGGRAGISGDLTGGIMNEGTIASLTNVRILGNRVYGANTGFLLGDVNHSLVAHNLAEGNLAGFWFHDVNGGAILDNAAIANEAGGFFVDSIKEGATFDANRAVDNGGGGFQIDEIKQSSFSHNQAIGNRGDGIHVWGEVRNQAVFTHNTASNNHGQGFVLACVRDSLIAQNTANNNQGNGFVIDCLRDSYFLENTAHGNKVGFLFGEIDGGDISGNDARDNMHEGFRFQYFNDVRIADNSASHNEVGFLFKDDEHEDAYISGNVANWNRSHGFQFMDGLYDSAFVHNTANNNQGSGFRFDCDIDDSTLSYNSASHNGGHGFEFGDLTGESIAKENFAGDNAGNGFHFGRIGVGEFRENVAEYNGGSGFEFAGVESSGWFTANHADRNGFDRMGNVVNTNANGFYFGFNRGQFSYNSADANANNGFGGPYETESPDGAFVQNSGEFSNNSATNNGDMGYRGVEQGGTVHDNTGSGNVGGGDTFPPPPSPPSYPTM